MNGSGPAGGNSTARPKIANLAKDRFRRTILDMTLDMAMEDVQEDIRITTLGSGTRTRTIANAGRT
jgi:hypothetical protein